VQVSTRYLSIQVAMFPGGYVSVNWNEELRFSHSGNHIWGVNIRNPGMRSTVSVYGL